MKKSQVLGLGLFFTGIGLFVSFGIELEIFSPGKGSRFWRGFGYGLTFPSLLACAYALLFMRDEPKPD